MRKAAIPLAAAMFAAAGVTASLALGGRPNNSGNKVTICHATGSKTNPYVRITPDASGVIDGHVGKSHQDGRDIIPPFDYVGKDGAAHHFPGQNWTAEGQAIYANGCKKPGAPTPTTPGATVPTQTVTVNVPTPGPSTTVRKVGGKRVVIVKKIHIRVTAKRAPKSTG